ncbi:MAG: PocR ligand-binding domain-containing protein [Phycisphaerae bacterium]|nr:PocR ligand-binding domain-containing protein [Phycisphaerae bacterium]
MKYELSDLLDLDRMQGLLDSFCEAVGIASAIIDLQGKVLVGARWQRICTDFHRQNPDSRRKCLESDTVMANELREERSCLYRCQNGLTDAAFPVVLEGEHVANFFVGQFLLEPPDEAFFRRQARKYGFDEQAYVEALSEVPVVPKEKLGPIQDFLVNFAGVLGRMGLDRMRQLEATKALARSQRRLELAHEGAGLGSWDWSVKTGEVVYDDRWIEMLGFQRDEIEPHVRAWEGLVHPEDLSGVLRVLNEHFEGRVPAYEAEYRLRTKSGQWKWILARGRAMEWDEQGKPLRASGTHLDITERKRAEKERRQLELQVQHAQKLESLGVLAGGIAHDFNNLLTGILGHADLAMMDLAPQAEARSSIGQIQNAAHRAADLCRQMLAYSGRGRFVIEPVNLNEVIREMADLLRVSISKKVDLAYHLGDALPSVMADATQIRQVVINLITNASEAIGSADGVISIATGVIECDAAYLNQTYLADDLPPGPYVFFEVRDTGCGMDDKTRARIFEPFFTTKFTGRGLGLAAVVGIVRGHQGTLEIASEPGKGSMFRALFPVHAAPAAPIEKQADAPAEWRGSGTILLVDDEEEVRSAGSGILERAGFTVLTAVDGQEAVDLFDTRAGEIACVLLDLTMPRMDGVEALRELRRIRPDVRVLLSSGYNEQEAVQRFSNEGPAAFIQKPYRFSELIGKIRQVLENG